MLWLTVTDSFRRIWSLYLGLIFIFLVKVLRSLHNEGFYRLKILHL